MWRNCWRDPTIHSLKGKMIVHFTFRVEVMGT